MVRLNQRYTMFVYNVQHLDVHKTNYKSEKQLVLQQSTATIQLPGTTQSLLRHNPQTNIQGTTYVTTFKDGIPEDQLV